MSKRQVAQVTPTGAVGGCGSCCVPGTSTLTDATPQSCMQAGRSTNRAQPSGLPITPALPKAGKRRCFIRKWRRTASQQRRAGGARTRDGDEQQVLLGVVAAAAQEGRQLALNLVVPVGRRQQPGAGPVRCGARGATVGWLPRPVLRCCNTAEVKHDGEAGCLRPTRCSAATALPTPANRPLAPPPPALPRPRCRSPLLAPLAAGVHHRVVVHLVDGHHQLGHAWGDTGCKGGVGAQLGQQMAPNEQGW